MAARGVVDEMLEVIRGHLGMEFAFVSVVEEGRRIFRHVASDGVDDAIHVGESHELDATYCTRIISGELEALTSDASVHPAVRDLAITEELGIRAYAGVPIPTVDGKVYGTLCAFSRHRHEFDAQDVHSLELAASLIANRLQGEELLAELDAARREVLDAEVRHGQGLRMVFQPIVELRSGSIRGYEALARFEGEVVRSPGDWFAMARRLGFDTLLQRQTAAEALQGIDSLPDGCFLTVNFSEDALLNERVQALLSSAACDRLVIELTEHQQHRDEEGVQQALDQLRASGLRVALDDVGAGYSGLDRVLQVSPDFIKLDRQLVTGVWDDPRRQAMVQAFATFGRAVSCDIIAEGIEAKADADALRILGVDMGQGFLLGKPEALIR